MQLGIVILTLSLGKPCWLMTCHPLTGGIRLAELCDQQGPTEVLRSKGVALMSRAFEAQKKTEGQRNKYMWLVFKMEYVCMRLDDFG